MKLLASLLIASALVTSALAQAPSNSVTLNWTNPSAYTTGQPLTINQVVISYDNTGTTISGSPATFTTQPLSPGNHTFSLQVCDSSSCSQPSNQVSVTIPGTPLIIPPVSNLSATVNP